MERKTSTITSLSMLLLLFILANFAGASKPLRQGDVLQRFRAQLRGKPTTSTFSTDNFPVDTSGFTVDGFEPEKVLSQEGLKEKDKITKLPGQPEVDFDQYGGYVTIDEKTGKALFYYFVEASGDKAKSLPLLLWLNGGPGCSSLAFGAMEELGPFRVGSDGKTLFNNPFAWNKVANVLFLESPAGVGFSYSKNTTDYVTGDRKTANDAYIFLVNWLERFPEYKGRDFYISGESYAGHYVPQLAHVVNHFNKLHKTHDLNLKGILIGNGVINDGSDDKGMMDFIWSHAFISDESIDKINKNCDFSKGVDNSPQCDSASQVYYDLTSEIDIYNVYGPRCFSSNLTQTPKRHSINNFDPCSDYYVVNYLNTPEVQQALHANVTKNVPGPWSPCSEILVWKDAATTTLPLIKEFLTDGIRVLIFSGDVDGRVPVTSSRYSINRLRLPVKTPWNSWVVRKETAGYTVEYESGLTFATVRGAGHEVPSFQPLRALVLVSNFLAGKPLPA